MSEMVRFHRRNSQEYFSVLRLCAATYRAGASVAELAQDYGVSKQTIYHRLKSMNVKMPTRTERRLPAFRTVYLRAHGVTLKAISEELGITVSGVSERLRLRGVKGADALLLLNTQQLEAYRVALDEDCLQHDDAMEIALESGGISGN